MTSAQNGPRKRLLVLNFFPAFTPPTSGGELRYFHVYEQLSSVFDVTLLSPTYPDRKAESIEHSPTFREHRVPKEAVHVRLHEALDAEDVCDEVSGLVCALSASYPNAYHSRYLELYRDADVVVHDTPFMLGYDLFFGLDDKPRVFNSHNYETKMFGALFRGPNAKKYLDFLRSNEGRLVRGAALVFAVSEEERVEFARDFEVPLEKIVLAPNGIDPADLRDVRAGRARGERKQAFFIGSAHPPNVQAAEFLAREVAPRLPHVDFMIAGTCCARVRIDPLPSNVKLVGLVDDAGKRALFRSADIAVNAMFAGGGTNLKTLEFLAASLPMVSTAVGVRGLGLVEGEEFLEADQRNFAERVASALEDPTRLDAMATSARERVESQYSWARIAGRMAEAIERIPAVSVQRLLLLNEFPVARAVSGGEVRINQLYRHVARRYPVTLVCLNDSGLISRTEIAPGFVELSIPKTSTHLREQARINAAFWVSASDIVSSYMARTNGLLVPIVRGLAESSDAVVVSHPFMADLLSEIPGVPVVHESHNFEAEHKRELLRGHPAYDVLVSRVSTLEQDVCERCNLLVTVTDEEAALMREASGARPPAVTIRNGVNVEGIDAFLSRHDVAELRRRVGSGPIAIFVGSSHPPNVKSARYIVETLAPACPDVTFAIAGAASDAALDGRKPPTNVLAFGLVSEDAKNALLAAADLALNPVMNGAGSNVKLGEYFAWGLPTVSTPFGARGYEVTPGRELVVAELSDFPREIARLSREREARQAMADAARSHARAHLDWRTLATEFVSSLETHVLRLGRRRLLVVTYRLTSPPPGGAEVHLLETLKALEADTNLAVDVVTVDASDIRDRLHFATEFSGRAKDARALLPGSQIHYFPAVALPEPLAVDAARALSTAWTRERREISLAFADRYREPTLLGGFHFPERSGDGYARWTSEEALVFLGGATHVTVSGTAPHPTELTLSVDGTVVWRQRVSHGFRAELEVARGRVLALSAPGSRHENDARTLGVRVHEVKLRHGARESTLALDSDYASFLREHHLDAYVDTLIDVAERRDPSLDALFERLRGPVSPELDRWVRRNARRYDAVFGQGLPFATAASSVRAANAAGVRSILLPHFHYEDDFYHWRPYYEALRGASVVLASAQSTIDGCLGKLGANAIVAGCGIDAREFETLDTSRFRALHPDRTPFFLVLGRKTGSKNYRWVVDAVRDLNRAGTKCDVVLIGRDEDGLALNEPHVRYLGPQPREVVLGALAECCAMVSMSESESLGLVVLEAWMAGRPAVVNARCQATAELVEHGVDGLHASKETLGVELTRLVRDPSYGAALASRGRGKALDGYTWSGYARRIDALVRGASDETMSRAPEARGGVEHDVVR